MMYGYLLFLLVLGVVIYMMMARGGGGCCGGHAHGDHQGHEGHGGGGSSAEKSHGHTHHHDARQMEAVADTDPVCGMTVSDERIETTHLGRTYHFCSEQCRKLFNLNPSKYVSA